MTRLRTVEEIDLVQPPPPRDAAAPSPPVAERAGAAGLSVLLLALRALSQRFVVALAQLQALLLMASVFWLAFSMRADPSLMQLVLFGLYGAVVLAVLALRRG